jgi:hypothetical protein
MSAAPKFTYGLNFAKKFQPEAASTSDAGQRSKGDFWKEVPIMLRLIRMCPKCRAKIMLRVRVGKRVMCPECKDMFIVAEAA